MKKKVLIVDDFEKTRMIIQNALSKLDCEFLHASNGFEALKFFNGQNIDLVITDLYMPEVNGIELVKEVRSRKRYEFIPIIMLSTERNIEKIRQAEEVKITAWVSKPFEGEQLIKTVTRCLHQSVK